MSENPLEWFERAVPGEKKQRGNEFLCHCPLPSHGGPDVHSSFTFNPNKGTWYCHTEKLGGGIKDLAEYLGLDPPRKVSASGKIIDKIYDYVDKDGMLSYQVVRYKNPKDFRQRRPDGRGGFIWDMKGVTPIPYRLPELLMAIDQGEIIFITEGEKDVDSLFKGGLVATTNHGGAGKWRDEHSRHFPNGTNIVVLPDNDDPGRRHAEQVKESLIKRGCIVKMIELPGLPPKGDVSDWLAAGHNKDELLRLIEAQEKEDNKEYEWPEPEEIIEELRPVEPLLPTMIPEPFREWLIDISHRMQCPIDFVANGAMVTTGAVVGAGCSIRPKARDNWTVTPNLWGGIIARPSMMKTPSLAEIMKPLTRLEVEAKEQYESDSMYYGADIEAYKAQKDALRADMQAIAKGKKNAPIVSMDELKSQLISLDEPDPPVRRRYRTNDSTIEKLGELLNENPRGILLFRDELVGLLCSWDREDRKQDRAFYLEAWNGYGSFTSDRIGRGTIDVANCCVSILGGIQPSKLTGYLQQATSELANDGMIQRFQLLVYPDEPKGWTLIDERPDTEAKNEAWEILKQVASMDFLVAGAELPDGEKIPYFRFSSDGQAIFNEWLTELEVKLRVDDMPVMTEHLAKYRSLMPSLALLFHLIEIAGGKPGGPVPRECAEMAAAWCDYLESHARRIYGLLGDVGIKAASELSRKIRSGKVQDGFSARDVYKNHWQFLDREGTTAACRELLEAGWLRKDTIEISGRQPKEIYRINPKLFSV